MSNGNHAQFAHDRFENSAQNPEKIRSENDRLRRELQHLKDRIVELERLADSDPLTRLANRRSFMAALEKAIGRKKRYGHSTAVIYMDLDRFKSVNDTHGHRVGDATLVFIADALQSMVRSVDTVARLGGDEFGIMLGYIVKEDALAKAERIGVSLLNRAKDVAGIAQDLSLSWGLSMVMADDTVDAVLDRADLAMYRRKKS